METGINQLGQEEYIWAMRTCVLRDSVADIWKPPAGRPVHTHHLPDGAPSHTPSVPDIKDKETDDLRRREENKTKVMASLIPDEVIYNIDEFRQRPYEACFLFGDVSGFTELAEKYSMQGISGPSRMTQVLNAYLGAMVQEVMSHNGDVLKFSGDAFLAMWKVTENDNMRDSVHQAIDCALVIQKSYGSYTTDVGVVIRVKLAVSAGHVIFGLIGDQRNAHYVVVGNPIWDVKAAEHKCVAGDIIVAPRGWHYVNASEYLYELMSDGVHNKILGIGPNWRSITKHTVGPMQKVEGGSTANTTDRKSSSGSSSGSSIRNLAKGENTEDFSLRPSINVVCRLNVAKDMRKFIILPVMNSIDNHEPFEYLTEMRQTVVVFINIISAKCQIKESVQIADQAYKCVCRTVNDHKGCVNKVSYFDKDLMLVVIFGLRGLKDELESQTALRCASKFRQGILKIKKVISASVGITTGKTYCGVFGHTLRREYTVISLIVNKAARLMCAYKDKVTCDRETFLHSKLEAKNFILQESKALKGITNPGPVYEFREHIIGHEDIVNRINLFPLLGRDEELRIYEETLNKFIESDRSKKIKNMVLIRGYARQGKTRVLEEMIYETPPELPINRFTLTVKDSTVPYQAIRLLFCLPLGIMTDHIRVKEKKLMNALRMMMVPELLCVLNNCFGVNFNRTDLYYSLTAEQKDIALEKMIRQLCYGCFVSTWVIAIDDLECIDKESAPLLLSVVESKNVFIVATMGPTTNKDLHKLRDNNRVEVISLKAIDRWYHGGLACQILDVYGIPAELEQVIQSKSNGNPGWIESYLISLLQSDGIFIISTDLMRIHKIGLVCPPLYMMERLPSENCLEWKKAMEENNDFANESGTEDIWKMYIDTCRNSYMNIKMREKLENRFKTTNTTQVCLIAKDFQIENVDAELSMDVIIMKTFDSLSSYEQLLVKCSAILGVQFLRDMLLYVMSATDERQAALAVKKLFEIRVLCCAKGDFVEEGNLVFRERLLNPNEEKTFECDCRGVRADDSCSDLPKYASCGYMQFRSPMFRDITYNLLTDNQKKEFHYRAIRYLEKETRKCRSCGCGYFYEIVDPRREEAFCSKRKRKRGQPAAFGWEDTAASDLRSGTQTGSAGTLQRKRQLDSQSVGAVSLTVKSESAIGLMMSDAEPSQKLDDKYSRGMGFTLIRRLKHSFSLTRTFSNADFRDCQCNLILMTTYSQLVEHCKGSGNLNKTIDAILEYAYVCITSCNIPLAIRVLNEGLSLIADSEADQKNKNEEDTWQTAVKRGNIYTLLGYSRMEIGQISEAIECLHKSLRENGLFFPTDQFSMKIKACSYECKQYVGLYMCMGSLNRKVNKWESVFFNNNAECLSVLCSIFIEQNRWVEAELAATWALRKALMPFNHFRIICITFAHMLRVAYHLKKTKLCTALEIHALRICHLKKRSVEAEELKAVAKLYGEIFIIRLAKSDLDKAIHIGYTVSRISSSIHAVKIILPLLPLLMKSLMMGRHISNAISILTDIDYFADEDTDISGRVWYYALCICFNLETGYTAVSYSQAERFFQVEDENIVTIRDPDARKRFFTVMWLWCIRNKKWEAASLWCVKSDNFDVVDELDSMSNKITATYLLEGLILYLVCKMDRRNIRARIIAEQEIESLISAIEKCSDLSLLVIPRLWHLKAYYRLVKYNDAKAQSMLHKASKAALKYNNVLESEYIRHSQQHWAGHLSPVDANFWREHNEPENMIDYRELEINSEKIGFYTLPIPVYTNN